MRLTIKPTVISEINKSFVKETLFEHGPMSKPEIARITKLSLQTVNKTVDLLCVEGYAKIHSVGASSGGRRPYIYVVNEKSALICAIFIQGMKVSAQLCGFAGAVLKSEALEFCALDGEDIPKIILDLISRMMDGYSMESLKIIGIGIPGIVLEDGSITGVGVIEHIEGMTLKSKIESVFDVPVVIENDVNMSALGLLSENKEYADLAYTYIGKGVGMGIVLNGKLYRGAGFIAGEVGKMVTDKYDENQDMLENEILDIFNKFFPDARKFSSERLNEIVTDCDELREETKRLIHLSTLLIINTFCFLDPGIIFLGGDLMCEPLVSAVKDGVSRYLGGAYWEKVVYEPRLDIGITGVRHHCMSKVNKGLMIMRGAD